MKRPLAILTLVFCLGIFSAAKIALSFIPAYLLAGVILAVSIFAHKRKRVFNTCLLFLAFLLGVIQLKNSQCLPACHISKYAYLAKEKSGIVKGFINDESRQEYGFSSFRLRAEEIQTGDLNRKACGEILVRVKSNRGFSYGQELVLRGNLCRTYLRRQGIWLAMQVGSEADVVRLNKDKGSKVKRFALWIKAKIENTILKYVSPGTAGILNAMILGDKDYIPQFIIDSMVKSGTIHVPSAH